MSTSRSSTPFQTRATRLERTVSPRCLASRWTVARIAGPTERLAAEHATTTTATATSVLRRVNRRSIGETVAGVATGRYPARISRALASMYHLLVFCWRCTQRSSAHAQKH